MSTRRRSAASSSASRSAMTSRATRARSPWSHNCRHRPARASRPTRTPAQAPQALRLRPRRTSQSFCRRITSTHQPVPTSRNFGRSCARMSAPSSHGVERCSTPAGRLRTEPARTRRGSSRHAARLARWARPARPARGRPEGSTRLVLAEPRRRGRRVLTWRAPRVSRGHGCPGAGRAPGDDGFSGRARCRAPRGCAPPAPTA